MHPKPLNPVSCHESPLYLPMDWVRSFKYVVIGAKSNKIASKYVLIFYCKGSSVVRTCDAKNKSDRLHNKGCYHKGQYNVTFFCIKRLCIQNQKAHDNLCFPLRRAYLLFLCIYFLCKSQSILLYSFLFSLLASIMWWGKI